MQECWNTKKHLNGWLRWWGQKASKKRQWRSQPAAVAIAHACRWGQQPQPKRKKLLAKIPIPILTITAIQDDSIDLLDLIIAIKTAANDFNDAHKDTEDESFEDA